MSEPKHNTRWNRFKSSPLTVFSAVLVLLFVFGAVFAPFVTPQNPFNLAELNLRDGRVPPLWQEGGKLPYLLGTDQQGRDVFSAILYGLRISLFVSISTVIISMFAGIMAGLWAGFYGKWVDAALMRLADVVFPFSTTLTAIFFMGLTNEQGILTVIVAISIINWVRYARTARGSTLAIKSEEFISAIEAQGAGIFRILFRHVLPNTIQPLMVVAAVDFAVVIVLESTLSFLGIGVPVTQPSLGMMISQGKDQFLAGQWWMLVFPGLALVLLTMGMNLIGDWLRDELDPRAHSN